MKEITVKELKQRINRGDAPLMIDVREPAEWEAGALDQAEKISLAQLAAPEIQQKLRDFGDQEVVFICRSGGRSGQATRFANQLGLQNATNLRGGMTAWRDEVDHNFVVG